MYAFTDHALADAIVRAANRGQKVRIYRDWQQYKEEEGRDQYVAHAFANKPNIAIRVKGTRDLMHLKEFSDGRIVREGSANWSPSGEKRQDNSIIVLSDAPSVEGFESKFNDMWERPNNFKVH